MVKSKISKRHVSHYKNVVLQLLFTMYKKNGKANNRKKKKKIQ